MKIMAKGKLVLLEVRLSTYVKASFDDPAKASKLGLALLEEFKLIIDMVEKRGDPL